MEFAAIVVAGGSSSRMGFDKLRADLHGTPVYFHCLQTLQNCPEIGQIIVVASEKNLPVFQKETLSLSKLTLVVAGGTERHLSVAAGLEKIASEFQWILVHDAARPLLSPCDLASVLAAAKTHGAASLATPVTDTLKRTDAAGFVRDSVERTNLWAMQTPQVFRAEKLRMAYAQILQNGELVTDEVSAVAASGETIKLIPPADMNFKITYPTDIELARSILSLRTRQ